MSVRVSRTGAGLLLVAASLACDQAADRVLPSVAVAEDGVQVAALDVLPPTLEPRFLWSHRVLREVPTYRAGEPEPLVYEPSQLLPLSGGALFILDPSADQPLVVVDPSTATAVSRFGRKGSGPGELGDRLTLAEDDESLIVLDLSNRQLHRFTRDGEPLSSRRIDLTGRGSKVLFAPTGGALLAERFRSQDSEWHNVLEGIRLDTGASSDLLRLPDPSPDAVPGQLQQGRAIWTVLDSAVVAMWSARPEVRIHSLDGGVATEVRLPLSRHRLSESEIQRQVELYGAMAAAQTPGPTALTNELYPVSDTVFAMLLSSVRRAAEDPAPPEGEIWWRMFTIRGEYVGVLRPPGDYRDFRVLYSGGGTVWARAFDADARPVLQELSLVRSDGTIMPSS